MRAIDLVRSVAPKALPNYAEAFEKGDGRLEEYAVTTPLRLCHFLSQTGHEVGSFTIRRESMRYTTPARISEIFGVGVHSAGVTPAEAKRLADSAEALAERVYGLGNPRKARELGNTRDGDGFVYRGNGIMQTTGRGNHLAMGKLCGLADLFERDPDLVLDPAYALLPALAEWRAGGCNDMADRNDLDAITRRINGGYNGLPDRRARFDKLWALIGTDVAWKAANANSDTLALQRKLNALGYGLTEDGRKGPKTTAAVRNFQKINGLKVDGAAGPITLAMLDLRAAATKTARAA